MKHIFVYLDQGVDVPFAQKFVEQLQAKYVCHLITAQEIIHTSWMKEADLLVIPGGRDLPYVELLHNLGTDRIKEYVMQGGRFLGICAGAYFASSYVEFDKGGSLHVEGERSLKFFPGKTVGPLFGPYFYDTKESAKIVSVRYQDEEEHFLSHSYYNGGCCFENVKSCVYHVLANSNSSTCLGIYDNGVPSIVRCQVGKGLAILSGVHFEQPLQEIIKENSRVRLMSAIFHQLEKHYEVAL